MSGEIKVPTYAVYMKGLIGLLLKHAYKDIEAELKALPRVHPWKKRKSPWNINRLRRDCGK